MANEKDHLRQEQRFAAQIDRIEKRKLRARASNKSAWLGLGYLGIVGWSVALPTLLGAFLGYWIDQSFPHKRSYTLALLIAGLALGCINAWFWISREHGEINKGGKPND